MVMLVTMEEASDHLRRDTVDDAADLGLKIQAASARVIGYIDAGMERYKDSNGDFLPEFSTSGGDWIPPDEVKAATLILIGYLYEQRDEDAGNEFDGGELPRPVRSLLRTFRIPVYS